MRPNPPLLLLWAAAACLPTGAALRTGAPAPRSVATAGAADQPPAKVFYLFLALGQIWHQDVWDRFFAPGRQGEDYEVFVHCLLENVCKQAIQGRGFHIVDTVDSIYCINLVSPMQQLLKAALERSSGSPRDKYVFLSGNSLPVKPFAQLQHTLTKGQEGTASFSYKEWCGGVKASQWSVLSYAHAARLANATVYIDTIDGQPTLPAYPNQTCHGCLDEMLPFSSIFGEGLDYKLVDLDPLRATLRHREYMWTNWENINAEVQFARAPAGEDAAVFLQLAETLQMRGADLQRGPAGPAIITRFSASGLQDFLRSEFLFVRKVARECEFAGNMSLADAFDGLVFRAP